MALVQNPPDNGRVLPLSDYLIYKNRLTYRERPMPSSLHVLVTLSCLRKALAYYASFMSSWFRGLYLFHSLIVTKHHQPQHVSIQDCVLLHWNKPMCSILSSFQLFDARFVSSMSRWACWCAAIVLYSDPLPSVHLPYMDQNQYPTNDLITNMTVMFIFRQYCSVPSSQYEGSSKVGLPFCHIGQSHSE